MATRGNNSSNNTMNNASNNNNNHQQSDSSSSSSSVQVAVRIRPMLASESGSTLCMECHSSSGYSTSSSSNHPNNNIVRIVGNNAPSFCFDRVLDGTTSQSQLYQILLQPLLQSCLEGYNATVLAYGQTGSGKTYTIMGDTVISENTTTTTTTTRAMEQNAGIIPRTVQDLFAQLQAKKEMLENDNNKNLGMNEIDVDENVGDAQQQQQQEQRGENSTDAGEISMATPSHEEVEKTHSMTTSFDYEVRIQFLELYGEEIRDLLASPTSNSTGRRAQYKNNNNNSNRRIGSSGRALMIRDAGGVYDEPEVLGATTQTVTSPSEALLCLTRGMMRRVTGSTAMNASSSRSHAIFTISMEQTTTITTATTATTTAGTPTTQRSKFHFVDLAGSERQKRTQAAGQRLKEGIDINKGLLVLGNVITALASASTSGNKQVFVPYRDSKLTRLLKGSLGGNHKTVMVACVSPSSNNLEESLNCLRYANRAKNIQNNAIVNVDPGTRVINELRGQVTALATQLLRVKDGDENDDSGGEFTIEQLRTIVNAQGNVQGISGLPALRMKPQKLPSSAKSGALPQSDPISEEKLHAISAQLLTVQKSHEQTVEELQSMTESLFTVRAEREVFRARLETAGMSQTVDAGYLAQAAAYEKRIADLLKRTDPVQQPRSPEHTRKEKVLEHANQVLEQERARLLEIKTELSNLPPKKPDSSVVAAPTADRLDAEEKAEEAELAEITNRYLKNDDDEDVSLQNLEEEGVVRMNERREQLEASLVHITKSIDDKENLIEQLEISQKKYSSMRDFYEGKLRQMEQQVRERETERGALLLELKKLEEAGSHHSETEKVQQRLKDKEQHIAGLRKRQNELESLTQVSSRNERDIQRLQQEIKSMKVKRVEVQKMITAERKDHMGEIQRLKKEVLQHDRQASKWKKMSDQKAQEADRAQKMAKARLDQMSQLKAKYQEAERRLRVRTVKRGVMEKAGLDAVMVGRRNTSMETSNKKKAKSKEPDIDSVRSFLDQKVADVGRKEALADKLANEWEDHLELVSQKERLISEAKLSGDNAPSEDIDSINVQLKFKQARIRQLAQRLGKKATDRKAKDTTGNANFLDDAKFKALVPGTSPLAMAKLAAKVLFGMVVRERRRVAALARTASSLDEKVVEARKASIAKDEAFRAYMDEERHERATMAQSQSDQILSLMAIVQEDSDSMHSGQSGNPSKSPKDSPLLTSVQGPSAESRMMLLANERIEALEQQLTQLQGEKETKDMYKAKDAETRARLAAKEEECSQLRRDLNLLRSSLRQIRDEVQRFSLEAPSKAAADDESSSVGSEEPEKKLTKSILDLVMTALHPVNKAKTKKSREEPDIGAGLRPKPFTRRLKRHVELMHTSDSEEDEEIPHWAGDIMADLAVIAEGEVPESLQGMDDFVDRPSQEEEKKPKRSTRIGTVFDRLTNPKNFTGAQRRKPPHALPDSSEKEKRSPAVPGKKKASYQERKAMALKASEALERVDVPEVRSHGSNKTANGESTKLLVSHEDTEQQHKSVFERLLSPDAYTGTQKEKMQEVRARKSQQAEKLLNNLLDSDDESELTASTPSTPRPVRVDSAPRSSLHRHHSGQNRERVKRTESNDDAEQQHKSVFERLWSPDAYTGTQKEKIQEVRARKSEQAEKLLNNLLDSDEESEKPTASPTTHPNTPEARSPSWSRSTTVRKSEAAEDADQHQSVFDRLLSPSAYTGTQKEKMQEVRARKRQQAETKRSNPVDGHDDLPQAKPTSKRTTALTMSRPIKEKVQKVRPKKSQQTGQ